jgi:hypothetical protein
MYAACTASRALVMTRLRDVGTSSLASYSAAVLATRLRMVMPATV